MAFITLRQANVVTAPNVTIKNSPLTNSEVDNNFANINIQVVDTSNTITTLSASVSVLEGNVSNLDTAVSVLEGNVSNLDTAVQGLGSTINNLSSSEISNGTSSITVIEDSDILLAGTIVPTANLTYDLGNTSSRFNEVYTDAVRFYGINNTNYIQIKGNSTVSSDISFNLPAEDGTAGQALVTDAAGNLYFAAAGATLEDDTTTDASYYVVITTATSGSLTVANVSTTKLYFNPNSGILNATDFNSLSDATLKTNLNPIQNATSLIDSLTGFEFDWKDSKRKSAGVIAQDVEFILPHLVSTNPEGKKSVNYGSLTAYLIECVKELTTRVKELENKNGL